MGLLITAYTFPSFVQRISALAPLFGITKATYRELNPGTPTAEPAPWRAGAGPASCASLAGSGGTACRNGSLGTEAGSAYSGWSFFPHVEGVADI